MHLALLRTLVHRVIPDIIWGWIFRWILYLYSWYFIKSGQFCFNPKRERTWKNTKTNKNAAVYTYTYAWVWKNRAKIERNAFLSFKWSPRAKKVLWRNYWTSLIITWHMEGSSARGNVQELSERVVSVPYVTCSECRDSWYDMVCTQRATTDGQQNVPHTRTANWVLRHKRQTFPGVLEWLTPVRT